MKKSTLSEVNQRISYIFKHQDQLVLDGDTHPSNLKHLDASIQEEWSKPNYYQGKPLSNQQLIEEMDMAGVDMCISWQNPAVCIYKPLIRENYEANYKKLLRANQDIHQTAQDYPERIIPCGWTDPKAMGVELACQLATVCVEEMGFPVVKMNPGQNAYPMDSTEVLEVVDHIVSLGAIPAFHFGGDTPFTSVEALKKIALRHPDHRIIAVHMGGGGSHFVDGDEHYIQTRELGLEHPNLFFVLSAIRDCHVESNLITYQLAGEPYCSNIACGSDAPYGKIVWNFGGFRAMFECLQNAGQHTDPRLKANPSLFDEKAVQNYMGRNLCRLILGAYEEILMKQSTQESFAK